MGGFWNDYMEGMNILHAFSINRVFLYRFLVNFKCIKVNLPHSRDLNEGVHVIVQTHLILIFQNQTFLAQYFFI